MNFIDYCIATKNYSTLNAIDEYTKSFGWVHDLARKTAEQMGVNYDELPRGTRSNLIKTTLAVNGKLRERVDSDPDNRNLIHNTANNQVLNGYWNAAKNNYAELDRIQAERDAKAKKLWENHHKK